MQLRKHFTDGHRTAHRPPLTVRYTLADFLAEVFGELVGAIERGLATLSSRSRSA